MVLVALASGLVGDGAVRSYGLRGAVKERSGPSPLVQVMKRLMYDTRCRGAVVINCTRHWNTEGWKMWLVALAGGTGKTCHSCK